MFKNYLVIILRNILRNKISSLINVLGLSIGMACTIMILLWVQDELSYDRFHENADNLYRVIKEQPTSNQRSQSAITPYPLAASLKKDYPEIIESTRWNHTWLRNVVYKDKQFEEPNGVAVDTSVFKMFTFPIIMGDPFTALSEPYSIVISRNMAEKYFETDTAIGKILRVDNKHDLKVTAIIENVPQNSHLHFDYIISFDTYIQMNPKRDYSDDWAVNFTSTYLLVKGDFDYKILNKKIGVYLENKLPFSKIKIYLQPVTEIHLHSDFENDSFGSGNIYNVYLFLIISLFILLISCINYICLTTARYSTRAKEVGIRKVSGAKRSQLIIQFLSESLFISFIALLISLCLIEIFLPSFNNVSGKQLSFKYFGNFSFILIALLTGLITGILSGIYPAFILSFFKPVNVLKGSFSQGIKSTVFRKGMVLIQWVMAIVLSIGAWHVLKQISYMKNKDLGFNDDQLIYLLMNDDLKQKYESIRYEFLKDPRVQYVTTCNQLPMKVSLSSGPWFWEGKKDFSAFVFNQISINLDFIEAFDLKVVKGRSFSNEYSSDIFDGSNINFIINETAVKKIGLNDPIGKWVSTFGTKGTIVGVIKDFNYKPLKTRVEPLMFYIKPNDNSILVVKIRPDNMQGTIDTLKKKLKGFIPNNPYEFRFVNDDLNNLYRSEKMISKIVNYFSLLGIFVASLGLFALVGFMAEQRTKEIGIRKTMGASAVSIAVLMSKSYAKLIIIAIIIAWPIVYYFLRGWLNNYAYRISLHWTTFLITGLIVLVISQLTVSYHTIKAAMADPVKALRYE